MSNNTSIRAALIGGIAPLLTAYPVKWQNKGIIKTGAAYTPNNEPWLRCTIMMGDSELIGLAKTDRIIGILQTDIFVPRGSGTLAAHQIVDTIRASMPINGESFASGSVEVKFTSHDLGYSEEETIWYRQSMDSSFYAFVDRTA